MNGLFECIHRRTTKREKSVQKEYRVIRFRRRGKRTRFSKYGFRTRTLGAALYRRDGEPIQLVVFDERLVNEHPGRGVWKFRCPEGCSVTGSFVYQFAIDFVAVHCARDEIPFHMDRFVADPGS